MVTNKDAIKAFLAVKTFFWTNSVLYTFRVILATIILWAISREVINVIIKLEEQVVVLV